MGKPIIPVTVISMNETSKRIHALFDTGSHYSIIREDQLPENTQVIRYNEQLGTANKSGRLSITGSTVLIIEVEDKRIRDEVLISPELGKEMIIGAKTMQSWDIHIENTNGTTQIKIKHDMRDPDIKEVAVTSV